MELPEKIQTALDAAGILSADVTERFIRGGGPGGQKINKTSSTVHLRHKPTGIEVRIQRERNQSANRELAWLELCEKLTAACRAERARQVAAREKKRRQKRQKSRAQKRKMVADKRHLAAKKSKRTRVSRDD